MSEIKVTSIDVRQLTVADVSVRTQPWRYPYGEDPVSAITTIMVGDALQLHTAGRDALTQLAEVAAIGRALVEQAQDLAAELAAAELLSKAAIEAEALLDEVHDAAVDAMFAQAEAEEFGR